MYDCYNYGGNWKNSDLNFDNILEGIFSLLTLVFNQEWIDLMNDSVDAFDIGF